MNSRFSLFAVLLIFGLCGGTWAEPATPTPTARPAAAFIFKSYDGVPQKPQSMSFQVDQADVKIPHVFLKIGDFVPRTKFKLVKFEYKTRWDPAIKDNVDSSELTLQNSETNEVIVLVLQ